MDGLTENLKYDTIEVGGIYEYNNSDTTIPVEVISKDMSKILNKENSSFLSFKLKNLITEKEFNVGIDNLLLEELPEDLKTYVFKFYPIGTFLKDLL